MGYTKENLEIHLRRFLMDLVTVRGLSHNTARSYERDIRQWIQYFTSRGAHGYGDAPEATTRSQSDTRATWQAQCDRSRERKSMDLSMVEGYVSRLSRLSLEISTINRKIAALRAFFAFLVRHGYLRSNPMSLLERARHRRPLPRTVSTQDMNSVLSCVHGTDGESFKQVRNCCMIEILYATGMRVSELMAIPHPPFTTDRTMLLVRGKGGKERMLAVHDQCMDAVHSYLKIRKKYLKNRNSPWLFFMLKDINRPMTRQCCNRVLRQWSRLCGLSKHIHPHMIRHTIASQLLHNGMNLRYLQHFLGHSSIDTVQIYTHVMRDDLVKSINRHPLRNYFGFRDDDSS